MAGFPDKFTLGNWTNVEDTSGCGDVANRDFGFDNADASYLASDSVAAWAGIGSC